MTTLRLFGADPQMTISSTLRFVGATGEEHVSIGAATGQLVAKSFLATSDARLKRDVAPLAAADELVARIEPVSFTWRHSGQRCAAGVLAQQLRAVVPDAVTADAAGTLSVDYQQLTALLLASHQRLLERVAALEARPGGEPPRC